MRRPLRCPSVAELVCGKGPDLEFPFGLQLQRGFVPPGQLLGVVKGFVNGSNARRFWSRAAGAAEMCVLALFLIFLIRPAGVPDPLHVGADWSWSLVCLIAAAPI